MKNYNPEVLNEQKDSKNLMVPKQEPEDIKEIHSGRKLVKQSTKDRRFSEEEKEMVKRWLNIVSDKENDS